MNFIKSSALGLSLSLISFSSIAQDEHTDFTEETVVTATLNKQSTFEVLGSADVISNDTMLKLQLSDFSDALRLLSGADVVKSGGPGSVTSVFTRGSNSTQTLMLIDGQRFSSGTLGSNAIQLIDPALITRAEFVRGSRSSIYGSDAIGGVLQLFTHDEHEQQKTWGLIEQGSNNHNRSAAGTRGSVKGTRYSLGFSALNTNGIDELVDDTQNNADTDALQNRSLSLSISQELGRMFDIGLSHYQSDSENAYDNLYSPQEVPWRDQSIRTSQLSFGLNTGSVYSTKLNLGQAKDISEEYDAVTKMDDYETTRNSAFWLNDLQLGSHTLINFGLDYYDEEIYVEDRWGSTYEETERDNMAVFIQAQATAGLVDFQIGTRHDDNSSYGTHNTSSGAIGLNFSDQYRLYASYAEGFKAPSFGALYDPESGNDQLKPEESANYEIGFKTQLAQWRLQTALFQNDVTNLINWTGSTNENIGEAELKGVEINTTYLFGQSSISANISYTDPTNKETGEVLNRRSKEKVNIIFDSTVDKVNYGLVASYYGERYIHDPAGNYELDAYSTLDAYIAYQATELLSLNLKINDMFDGSNTVVPDYNVEDRNMKASLRFEF